MSDVQKRLAEPFSESCLRQLNKGGRTLTYVPAPEVIARLNDVLGTAGWSTSVEMIKEYGDHPKGGPVGVVAQVRLSVHSDGLLAHYDGMGGQQCNRKSSGEILDLGDDYKGAVSDAMKKAATHLGVGLHLARAEDALLWEQQQEANRPQPGWNSIMAQDEAHKKLAADIKAQPEFIQELCRGARRDLGLPWPAPRADFETYRLRVAGILADSYGTVQEAEQGTIDGSAEQRSESSGGERMQSEAAR